MLEIVCRDRVLVFGSYLFVFESDFMYVFVYSFFCGDVVPSVSKYVSSVRLNCGCFFFVVRVYVVCWCLWKFYLYDWSCIVFFCICVFGLMGHDLFCPWNVVLLRMMVNFLDIVVSYLDFYYLRFGLHLLSRVWCFLPFFL